MRHPPLPIEYISQRLRIDAEVGKAYWINATKHHRNLLGKEAGFPRHSRGGKFYWVIKIDGIPYLRSQLILSVSTGIWPTDMVDHKNGDSLDDRAENLRHATGLQNAWNHKNRSKNENTPMGVRKTSNGRYQARIACEKKQIAIGVFATEHEAHDAYIAKRKELYREYSGL